MSAAAGLLHYFERRPGRAVPCLQKTLKMDSKFYPARCFLGLAYEQAGEVAKAVDQFQKAVDLSGGAPAALAMLGHAQALAGQAKEARAGLKELKKLSAQHYVPPVRVGLIHAALEEKQQAFEWLEKAYRERSHWLLFLNVDPIFDPLRSDPRFRDLLRRVGLPCL